MKYINKNFVRDIFRRFGYEISYYQPNLFSKLYPNCLHDKGFVFDIFGHLLYQNVTDIPNYRYLMGLSLHDYRNQYSNEIAEFISRIKPGQTVLDVGANIGMETLLIAKLVGPQGKVIAFEPGPVSFCFLKINIILNGYKNVTIVNKGVTEQSQTEYYFSGNDQTRESGASVAANNLNIDINLLGIQIETVSLDEYFSNFPDMHIDYIRMDIIGGEYNALKGMKKLLAANPGIWLTIDYAPYLPLWKNVDLQEFLDFIRAYGFEIFDLRQNLKNHEIKYDKPVSDKYLLEQYPKHAVGKYATLLLQRTKNDLKK